MTQSPCVAVITPVYQGEDYLAEALESVQAQTYANLVHVVLDNASTDATPQILERFQGLRVPLHVHRNASTLSQVENWNKAFSLAPSQVSYVRLLCHDDTLVPEAIARLVEASQVAPDIGMISSNHFSRGRHEDFGWQKHELVMDGAQAARLILTAQRSIMAPQIMLHRDAIAMRTPLFDGSFSGWDQDACIDLLTRGCKFAFVQESLCMTRVHADSVSSTVLERDRLDLFQRCLELQRYGPRVFAPEEQERLMRRYRRFYLRKLVRWSVGGIGGIDVAAKHWKNLAKLGVPPGPIEMLDSLVDWPLGLLGMRPRWGKRASDGLQSSERPRSVTQAPISQGRKASTKMPR